MALLRSGPAGAALAAWVAAVGLPVLVLLVGKRRGWWGGSELVTRAERFVYLPVAWTGSALAWAIARRWAAGSLLAAGLGAVVAWLAASTLLTFAWKVSLHTGGTGLMAGMVALELWHRGAALGCAALAAGTLVAGAVAASRLALRRHTPAQLAVGYLMGLAAATLSLAGGALP